MAEIHAFFYGTLMHPKILERVIRNDGSHLEICPAALMVRPYLRLENWLLIHDQEHTRHKVKVCYSTQIDIEYYSGRVRMQITRD